MTRTREITHADADAFESFMCGTFNARVFRKSSAFEMKFIGAAFDIVRLFGAKVPAGHDFERYATTLGIFIYLPDGLSPEARIEMLTHEIQHVRQFTSHGLDFAWLYLAEPEARAKYEAEAYAAGLAVHVMLNGELPSLDEIAMPLEGGYALDAEHVQLARGLIEQAATSLAKGITTTLAGVRAVEYLRRLKLVT